jgi:hypothetical protein
LIAEKVTNSPLAIGERRRVTDRCLMENRI